jgi:hypothetical protein
LNLFLRLIERLPNVSLAYCKINSIDRIDSFKAIFKCVKEIDIEGNLLNSWEQVFTILDNLKAITLLNVT